jgi:TetR/AcrR family transcriptional repressor of nem operon
MKSEAAGLQSNGGTLSTQDKLLDAAIGLMLEKGYTATSIADICRMAGVSKGGFFHYFADKEALVVAAIGRFVATQSARIRSAPFHAERDPLDRLFGALDFMLAGGADPTIPKSCLLGNLVQEVSATHPQIRERCNQCLSQRAGLYKAWLDEAVSLHRPETALDTQGLADYLVATLQGTLILYKASGDLTLFTKNVAHYKNYVRKLFGR